MTIADLLTGSLAPVFSDTIILVMLLMMLVVSTRLLFSRRKKAYFSMTVSLIMIVIQYVLLLQYHANPAGGVSGYWTLVLKIVSFIFVNLGIFQLYNATRGKHYFLFYLFVALTVLISLIPMYSPHLFSGTESQVRLLQGIWLELYLFVLIFLCFYLIAPFIGQNGKYQLALTVFFTDQIAHVLNLYVFGGSQPFLSFMERTLPIVFYFFLYLILFERVVELMQAIYNSSITDGLTSLYNRKFFCNRVQQYVSRGYPVSVLFSDIDNFKKLNDTKGHHIGDEVLKQVAEILKQESEDCGIAGRYGGEEMVVLITDPSVNMDEFAETIRSRVEAETIVTVSLGYSKYKNGLTADQLIKQADEAMYQAKTTGKNKAVKYASKK
jgi:diguanylate cyclase (GGDEF)-like protein